MPSIAGRPLYSTASEPRSASSVSSLSGSACSTQFALWHTSSAAGRSQAARASSSSRLQRTGPLHGDEHPEVDQVDEVPAGLERDPRRRQIAAVLDDQRGGLEHPP